MMSVVYFAFWIIDDDELFLIPWQGMRAEKSIRKTSGKGAISPLTCEPVRTPYEGSVPVRCII